MTTDLLTDVIPGTALFGDGTVTIGTYARGGDVSLLLTDQKGARKILVTGNCGSGKSTLLRLLYAGAVKAGIETDLIDPFRGDVQAVAEQYRTLVADVTNDRAFRLLLVDHLTELDDETLTAVAEVARYSRRANVAVVVATVDHRLGSRTGMVVQHMSVGAHVKFAGFSLLVPIEAAPGVGEVNGDLFRAWWPGS